MNKLINEAFELCNGACKYFKFKSNFSQELLDKAVEQGYITETVSLRHEGLYKLTFSGLKLHKEINERNAV